MEDGSFNPLLFCCILDCGKGTKMFKLSKELGGLEGTIFMGRGTVRDEWLNILGVVETRREIFLTIIDEKIEDTFYQKASEKFALGKRHHGIAFSLPLKYFIKGSSGKAGSGYVKEGKNNMDYQAIFIVADKNRLDDILEAAEAAGSTGGTVIHGRGAGCQEKAKLFNIEIEPEKNIVLILAEVSKADAIVASVSERLNIKEPNSGIIFVLDVSRTLGLFKG
ncbi:MAG: P-II family nitrogen regulator [Christensenellales bacterium]|jgi:nitrogen regulatory protein PII